MTTVDVMEPVETSHVHGRGVWEHFTVLDGLPDMKVGCLSEDASERSSHYHARTSGSIADLDDWQDDGRDLTVADIMSTNVVIAHRGTSVKELAEMMVTHDIHRIVILDASNIVGIVGTLDVLRAVSQGRLS
ncbi:MAG: CBS domain-containing protein [Candidatus Latescibacterota bacterium]|nr:CBS domain-containing protein [Candidatus Latescibacterota bacterium]